MHPLHLEVEDTQRFFVFNYSKFNTLDKIVPGGTGIFDPEEYCLPRQQERNVTGKQWKEEFEPEDSGD